MAGIVAEELDDDPVVECWDIVEGWEVGLNPPSPADLTLCSPDWSERSKAVQEALAIIRKEKRLFEGIVAELLEGESLTDGQMTDLAARLLSKQVKRKKGGKPAAKRKKGK